MNKQRTSETHPINLCGFQKIWPGTLFMTFAPGKKQNNAMTGTWNRCLDEDLNEIRNHYKVDVLVCLIQQLQMVDLKIPNLLSQCEKIGIKTQWFPVIDNTVPKKQNEYKELVKKVVDQYLKKGKNVVVHCKGGLGRAGTFGAACLIYSGFKPHDAISQTRKVRKNTINCFSQQQWLMKQLKF